MIYLIIAVEVGFIIGGIIAIVANRFYDNYMAKKHLEELNKDKSFTCEMYCEDDETTVTLYSDGKPYCTIINKEKKRTANEK